MPRLWPCNCLLAPSIPTYFSAVRFKFFYLQGCRPFWKSSLSIVFADFRFHFYEGILWPLEGMPYTLRIIAKFLPNTLACTVSSLFFMLIFNLLFHWLLLVFEIVSLWSLLILSLGFTTPPFQEHTMTKGFQCHNDKCSYILLYSLNFFKFFALHLHVIRHLKGTVSRVL